MRHRSLGLALVLSVALVGPSASFAAEPGVHVDPNSPAGKEYQLPLETARQQAAGGTATGGRGSGGSGARGATSTAGPSSAPLFGQGITPPRSRGLEGGNPAGHGDVGLSHARSRRGRLESRSRRASDRRVAARRHRSEALLTRPSSGLSDGVLVAIAAGVLLSVAGLGLVIRRAAPS
jgi:hypothetical protein